MDASFYTAARGAMTEQEKLNVISNNMANVNTCGYRAKTTVFSDLLYYNMHSYDRNSTGTGVKVQHTNTSFEPGGITAATDGGYNFAIEDEGFFMLQDQIDGSITYTRAGNFSLSIHGDGEDDESEIYLISDTRKLVLDRDGEPIRLVDEKDSKDYVEDEDDDDYDYDDDDDEESDLFKKRVLSAKPAIYTFENMNDMQAVGNNEYRPIERNGEPILLESKRPVEGYLELSNEDIVQDMADVVIASRAYSYALKMVTTSDEVEQTINGLR